MGLHCADSLRTSQTFQAEPMRCAPTQNFVWSLCDSTSRRWFTDVSGWDVSCHGRVTTGAIYAERRNRSFLNPNQPILSQRRSRGHHPARQLCSTWNTLNPYPQNCPLKSHRRKSSRNIRFDRHSLGKNVTRGKSAASRRRIPRNRTFHVEHKTHFAQKSEALT